jgi:hypothetical protein
LVQPYLAISTSSIILGIGAKQRSFTCNLNFPQGDQVSKLVVPFAKI